MQSPDTLYFPFVVLLTLKLVEMRRKLIVQVTTVQPPWPVELGTPNPLPYVSLTTNLTSRCTPMNLRVCACDYGHIESRGDSVVLPWPPSRLLALLAYKYLDFFNSSGGFKDETGCGMVI